MNNIIMEAGSISVAIASYNGIKYIQEQLDSIRTQTLHPDEVIIADDKSSDGTYEFCRDYIESYGLIGWRVHQHSQRTGLCKNFRGVMAQCTGEYIFTCDQDAIWVSDKVSSMVSVLKEHPEITLLASNYIALINGKPAKVHMKHIDLDDGTVIPIRLKDSGLTNLRPGCTFCFRHRLLEKFGVMDIENHLHDSMLWKYAIASDSLYLLNRQLIFWRRHEGVATGVSLSAYPLIERRIRETYSDEEMYRKFIGSVQGLEIPAHNVKFMNDIVDFLRRRRNMLTKKSVLRAGVFVIKNMKYYPTLRNALSDVYAMIFLRK